METTAEIVYERHHKGYRCTIRCGEGANRTQRWFGNKLTLEDIEFQMKKHGCTIENLTVRPPQA